MSFPEIIYRSNQQVQKQLEKKGVLKVNHTKQDYVAVLNGSSAAQIDNIPAHLSEEFRSYDTLDFFTFKLDVTRKIDWHLDISSGKSFPLSFAKDIDIRSGTFGSAKVVWEINRLQFLLPLAIKYTITKDEADLKHWMELVTDWIDANPYMRGINWYSNIEVNIRLMVWYFCWQVLFGESSLQSNKAFNEFAEKHWLPCIYEHCVYSYSNPSKYSSANNHLISEYAGLFTASCCWPFAESEKWKAYAQKGLEKEIVLQHSASGINKEQAAEYIQFITDFFLIPYAVGVKNNVTFSVSYKYYLLQIASYISTLMDAQKGYRKYGDEDDGKVLIVSTDQHFDNFSSILTSAAIIFKNSEFKEEGQKLDLKNWLLFDCGGANAFQQMSVSSVFKASKFYTEEGQFFFKKVEDASKEIYLHLDAAPLGFLSIAAHGHADALSIALHVDGNPIITDIGTFTYHTDKEWRAYFISTLAHNTICIDGKNQALQAGPTMWLDHYDIYDVETSMGDNKETVSASHSGYRQMGCRHRRTVEFNKSKNIFTIIDEVETDGTPHDITLPWHLHPLVSVENSESNTFLLNYNNASRKVKIKCDPLLETQLLSGQTDPIMGWYSPSFLKKEPTKAVIGKLRTSLSKQYLFTTTIEIL